MGFPQSQFRFSMFFRGCIAFVRFGRWAKPPMAHTPDHRESENKHAKKMHHRPDVLIACQQPGLAKQKSPVMLPTNDLKH